MTTWNDIDPSAWFNADEGGGTVWALRLQAPADCTSLTSIRVYCHAADATTYHIKAVLIKENASPPTNADIVTNGVSPGVLIDGGTTPAWYTCTFATPPAVTGSDYYWMGFISDFGVFVRQPTTGGPGMYYFSTTYATIADTTSPTGAANEAEYNQGIQGIYTAGGGASIGGALNVHVRKAL